MHFPFEHPSIFIPYGHFLLLVQHSLLEPSQQFHLPLLEHSSPFGVAIDPLPVVVELSPLILTCSVFHSLPELPHVYLLASDQLSLPLVEVVLEVAYVLVVGVGQLAVALPHPLLVLPLKHLVPVQVEPAPTVLVSLDQPNVYVLHHQRFVLQKAYLLSLELPRKPPATSDPVVVPVVSHELFLPQSQGVFVVVDQEGGQGHTSEGRREVLVVELQEVSEGTRHKQTREGNASHICGDEGWELFTPFADWPIVTLLLHHFVLVDFLPLALSLYFALLLVLPALLRPLPETEIRPHNPHERRFQERVEPVPDPILAPLIPHALLRINNLLQLLQEHLFSLGDRLPGHSRFLLLHRTVLQIDQHLNPVVIGLFQQAVGRPDEETPLVVLLETGQLVEVLDVEGHRHEVVRTESAQGQGVLPQALHVAADRLGVYAESGETWEEGQERDDEGTGRGGGVGEDHHSLLVEHCLPDLVEIGDSKEVDDGLEVRADVELLHVQPRPALPQVVAQVLIGRVDEGEIGEIPEEELGGAGQSQFEIPEQGEGGDDGEGFLEVGTGDFAVFGLHFLGDFDLFEVGHSEKHAFAALDLCLEVEEVVVFHLVVGGVGHGVVHHQVVQPLRHLVVGVAVLHLRPPLVVEVYHGQTHHRLLHLLPPFFVLVYHLLEEQSMALHFCLAGGHEDLPLFGREGVLGRGQVGVEGHVVLLEQVVGDVVVGVAPEVGLVLVVGLQVDLGVLEHPQRPPEATGDLLVDHVHVVGDNLQLLQLLGQELLALENELHYYYALSLTPQLLPLLVCVISQ